MNPEIIDMTGGDTYRARAIHQLLTTDLEWLGFGHRRVGMSG